MVSVKEIIWISKEILEAEVIVTDGRFEILCFSHPCRKKKGEELTEPLHALDTDRIVRLEVPSLYVKKLNKPFDYLIQGKLIDKSSGIIELGDIVIEIGRHAVPGDLKNDEYISCVCDRLDIY